MVVLLELDAKAVEVVIMLIVSGIVIFMVCHMLHTEIGKHNKKQRKKSKRSDQVKLLIIADIDPKGVKLPSSTYRGRRYQGGGRDTSSNAKRRQKKKIEEKNSAIEKMEEAQRIATQHEEEAINQTKAAELSAVAAKEATEREKQASEARLAAERLIEEERAKREKADQSRISTEEELGAIYNLQQKPALRRRSKDPTIFYTLCFCKGGGKGLKLVQDQWATPRISSQAEIWLHPGLSLAKPV
ncbi:hypothetical protein J3R30DRAFT_3407781 [Lentinula aciculospora]|uniref:Uncharacterized protein n=1 Tax=Lentinula aciculospora TaxID=153920 RepID=A0A9W9A1Y3_9AGAR|nr:hypothetical protein J3R30DRAFT_3407781 [Lentinula aciculospora]